MWRVFLLLTLSWAVTANITGQHPKSGTCMCISGTGVHARTKAGLSGSIHATVNSGDCFKFHGGILTTDGYTWYQLQHVSGSENLWVAGNFINTATSSHCSSTSSGSGGCTATAKDYACRILAMHNSGKIHLWERHPSGVHDNAYSYNNIKDTCDGHKATVSHYTCAECRSPGAPGGQVCLNEQLLKYIYDVGVKGYAHINEVAGACHSCHSYHYRGRAVDIDPGSRRSDFITMCRNHGGWALDEGNHIHCEFRH
ncbi:hypothetical protein FSP39_011009 [Pinctada imbricata]|uniref:SH3b domain-containing protein n=1 Tax=Pinctada imbricata TaxID=66713 RepID=A0AA88YJB3_PINIB|nr:hypothetical protein FSP39_011009 [Pinctada imbricata]